MYNLTVAEAHTYLVGYGQWVVHNSCTYQGKSGKDVFDLFQDRDKVTQDEVLDAGAAFLGENYREIDKGVFVSADNTRRFRITNEDLATVNNHAGAPHANFEIVKPIIKWDGTISHKIFPSQNKHIYFLP